MSVRGIDTPPTDKMATFYAIHCYDQNTCDGDDQMNNYRLYTTFEKAADALDVEIKEHIEIYNAGDDGPLKFEPQDRKRGEEHLKTRNYYHYYELDFGLLFVISKMTVVE